MWDGRIKNAAQQAELPIVHPDEMAETPEHVAEKLNITALYPTLFYKAYGDSVATSKRLQEALADFMLTLISADTKYDSVMRHQSTFNTQQENGYRLFKQHCNACHTEPLFTNFAFENNGLAVDTQLNDVGRMKITGNRSDSLKFKVPTLRNIEFSYPYMHDGRFKKLYDVLGHYTAGITPSPTLSPLLQKPITLTANEKIDLIAFLVTLSDRHFINNKDYSYPKNIFSPTVKDL
jgi:cytochrome c peroxidase